MTANLEVAVVMEGLEEEVLRETTSAIGRLTAIHKH